MPIQAYYSAVVNDFLEDDPLRILGVLTEAHRHATEEDQRRAWQQQIPILKDAIFCYPEGRLFLELYIPRMGKRADAALIAGNIVFLIEFKVWATEHTTSAFDQVEDYALDLKNFHEGSHSVAIVPILVSSHASAQALPVVQFADDLVAKPVRTNAEGLGAVLDLACSEFSFPPLDVEQWIAQGYRPTPTIIQAAEVLYRTHHVEEIRRNDAEENLAKTREIVFAVMDRSRSAGLKSICFVTGVPGSGKTLAGLDIATRRSEEHAEEHAVFLSGNGPLVDVLREALARDQALRESISKKTARRKVASFIQNIHHFRDDNLPEHTLPPEKVVVFDEAQRAWTREQLAKYMMQKRNRSDFKMSEPEFLLSVMDRHPDWCTVVCLVGGGQEINTGEAGISEWINALETRFPHWKVHISPRMALPEYGSSERVKRFLESTQVEQNQHLHLAVSMRSFRAEALSTFVQQLVDNEPEKARATFLQIKSSYPIYITRELETAREWLRSKARGTERFGLVASSKALRLKAEGIHVKAEIAPHEWFLNDRTDVRSSFYLEDVATEFAVQGLELDWAGVCWDGDFQHTRNSWVYRAFKGTKWQSIADEGRQNFLKNAYRVILMRARQGMILFIPKGDLKDPTRLPAFYDGTFQYLLDCGLPELRNDS